MINYQPLTIIPVCVFVMASNWFFAGYSMVGSWLLSMMQKPSLCDRKLEVGRKRHPGRCRKYLGNTLEERFGFGGNITGIQRWLCLFVSWGSPKSTAPTGHSLCPISRHSAWNHGGFMGKLHERKFLATYGSDSGNSFILLSQKIHIDTYRWLCKLHFNIFTYKII